MTTKLSCQITLPPLLFTDASPTPSPMPDTKAKNWQGSLCKRNGAEVSRKGSLACPYGAQEWRPNSKFHKSLVSQYTDSAQYIGKFCWLISDTIKIKKLNWNICIYWTNSASAWGKTAYILQETLLNTFAFLNWESFESLSQVFNM